MAIEVQNIKLEPPYMVIKPDVSEEEYFALTDEDTNAELIQGEMIMFSPANLRHEKIFRFLLTIMNLYVRRLDLGEVLGSRFPMRLAPGTLPEPDLFFVAKGRLDRMRERYMDGAADLVVELLSPGTRRYDLERKRPLYQEHRVRECWFIDPEREEITIDRLEKDAYRSESVKAGRVESGVLPGFWLQAEWLWQDQLPDELEVIERISGR